jgi:hypothetical protein
MMKVYSCKEYNSQDISFSKGKTFYVLSMSIHERMFFVSTDPRVPFSRFAKNGFVPMDCFSSSRKRKRD